MKAIAMMLAISVILSTSLVHALFKSKQKQQQPLTIQQQIDLGYTNLYGARLEHQIKTDDIAWQAIRTAQANGLIASIDPYASVRVQEAARIYNASLKK